MTDTKAKLDAALTTLDAARAARAALTTLDAARAARAAINGPDGHCLSCGRDNSGSEGEPCDDDCPMYWEAVGIEHPEHPQVSV